MKRPQSPRGTSRRSFLFSLGAGGVAAGAAIVAHKSPTDAIPQTAAAPGSKGYQLTEHVQNYYRTTRI